MDSSQHPDEQSIAISNHAGYPFRFEPDQSLRQRYSIMSLPQSGRMRQAVRSEIKSDNQKGFISSYLRTLDLGRRPAEQRNSSNPVRSRKGMRMRNRSQVVPLGPVGLFQAGKCCYQLSHEQRCSLSISNQVDQPLHHRNLILSRRLSECMQNSIFIQKEQAVR